MPTLVLSPRFTDDSTALWRAAIERGWDVVRATGWQLPPRIERPVLYGETMFVDRAAEQLGATLLEPAADWLPRLPSIFRMRNISLATLGEARASWAPVFVKPATKKAFPAAVIAHAGPFAPDFDDSEPVLISDVVQFDAEVRCWALDGKIVASARYRGGPCDTDIAEDVAWSAAERGAPAAVVIDVGRLTSGEWVVVEANPASSSGIYGADPAAVLDVLERATIPKEM